MERINKKAEVAAIFYEVSKILKRSMRKSFENVGITIPQSFVIHTLMEFGEMKISDLSKRLSLSNSTISGIVDRLEKQQLVVRTRSEEDRRIVYVNIAPTFKQIHKGFYKKAQESFGELLSPATTEELEKVIEGLNTLKQILNDKNE